MPLDGPFVATVLHFYHMDISLALYGVYICPRPTGAVQEGAVQEGAVQKGASCLHLSRPTGAVQKGAVQEASCLHLSRPTGAVQKGAQRIRRFMLSMYKNKRDRNKYGNCSYKENKGNTATLSNTITCHRYIIATTSNSTNIHTVHTQTHSIPLATEKQTPLPTQKINNPNSNLPKQ